mgnify:CR=1 FL=1
MRGRADEDLARQPAPGEWSARQTLEHLLFTEELLAMRIERLLTELLELEMAGCVVPCQKSVAPSISGAV